MWSPPRKQKPWENHLKIQGISLRRFLTCSLKEQPRMRLRCFAMKAAPRGVRTGWESTEKGGHYGKLIANLLGSLFEKRSLWQTPGNSWYFLAAWARYLIKNQVIPRLVRAPNVILRLEIRFCQNQHSFRILSWSRKRPFILSQEKNIFHRRSFLHTKGHCNLHETRTFWITLMYLGGAGISRSKI